MQEILRTLPFTPSSWTSGAQPGVSQQRRPARALSAWTSASRHTGRGPTISSRVTAQLFPFGPVNSPPSSRITVWSMSSGWMRCCRRCAACFVTMVRFTLPFPMSPPLQTASIGGWRAGGHVNAFISPTALAAQIEKATGLPHVATRVLCSSLSFLNRKHAPQPRALLIGGGHEWSLFLYTWLSRRLDRFLGTRSSVYGWALYFGNIPEPVGAETWLNVCIGCGAGHSALSLQQGDTVRQGLLGVRTFQCPACQTINPFAEDAWASTWLNRELRG